MQFRNLISENSLDDGTPVISLGRVSFWLILSFCSYFWFCVEVAAFPPTLFYTLGFLMIYNVSKKSLKSLDVVLQAWADKKLKNAGDITQLVKDVAREIK